MNLMELVYQRCKARRAATELLDKAVTEARELTAVERVQCDALTAQLQTLDAAIEARAALRQAA